MNAASSALVGGWVLLGRVQRRLGLVPAGLPPYRALFGPYVAGRSFADVGAMWSVHGRYAFDAEELGATAVTAFDGMSPTEEFEREHRRRDSALRFVQGDINDPAAVERIGVHDVVWCSGVVYHSPDPHLTVRHLCALAGELVFVGSRTMPELPGAPQACVFLPRLAEPARRPYTRLFPQAVGLSSPFDPGRTYENWWWAMTPSALVAMVASQSDFEIVEVHRAVADTVVVARRRADGDG